MRIPRSVFVALIGCTGCMSISDLDLQSAIDRYDTQKKNGIPMREITNFRSIEMNTPEIQFTINESSQFAQFDDGGGSYFQAFTVPSGGSDCRIKVRSYPFRSGDIKQPGAFFPIITVFDASKKPVASTTFDQIQIMPPTLFDEPSKAVRFDVTLRLSSEIHPQYVIVHTSREWVGSIREFATSSPGSGFMVSGIAVIVPSQRVVHGYRGAPVSPPDQLKAVASPGCSGVPPR